MASKRRRVKFLEWTCTVRQAQYQDGGGVALILEDTTDGEHVATATVNVPGVQLQPGEAVIKTWTENEGILEALETAGVVQDTGRRVRCGYAEGAVVRVTL